MGILRHRRRRAVVEGDLTIAKRLWHLDGVAGEIFVVVGARRQRQAGRRLVLETLQEGIDVIRALLLELREEVEYESRKAALVGPRFCDERQVRRQRAAIGRARGLFVGEWRGEVIRRTSRAIKHFTLVVRAVLDLVFGCKRRGLR